MPQRKLHPKERIIPIEIEGQEDASRVTSTASSIRNAEDKKASSVDGDTSSSIKEQVASPAKPSQSSKTHGKKPKPDTSSDETLEVPKRTIANYNVPEKIVIVFDRAVDENSTNFEMTSGKQYSPLLILKQALQIFLLNKTAIDAKHEFALIFLNECTATWVHDFTSSPQDIIASLQSTTSCEPEDIFDLNTVFDLISENVTVHPVMQDLMIPPAYVVRIILLYGRSYSLPSLKMTTEIDQLLNSAYFTVDVVMTHEPPSSANNCDKIFKVLQEIDTKAFSYSFSVSRNASELHKALAKVLAHPLQRAPQHIAKYNLKSFD